MNGLGSSGRNEPARHESPRQPDLFDLRGRVAVVTGGTRGLGRAIAAGLARAGAEIIVSGRRQDIAQTAASEIAAATGVAAIGIGCHVGHWDQCNRLAEQAHAAFGHVDILVNNAGMSPLYPSIAEVSEELFDKVIGVNLKGPFRLAALIGTQMVQGHGGSIINVSSIAAVEPSPQSLPYATAKAGLNALTLGLARLFAPSVRVNAIMPGPFLTDVSKSWDMDAFDRRAATQIPLRRGGQADEIVGAALYLASDAASYTTGAIIKVDGGAAFSPG